MRYIQKQSSLASRLWRAGKRSLAVVLLALFVASAVPAPTLGPAHQIMARPADGQGDSPLVP